MILIDRYDTEHNFKACTVKVKDVMLLAIYFSELSDNEEECGLHLTPDKFMVVDQIEPKLLLREIDYEELNEALKNNTTLLQQKAEEPDYVFERIDVAP